MKKEEKDMRDKDTGRFISGHPRMGGKKAGQKTRTQEMTQRILDLVEQDFWDEEAQKSWFCDDMARMLPKDRRQVMLQLLKTVMPNVTSVSLEDNKTVSSIRQLMENMAAYKRQPKD